MTKNWDIKRNRMASELKKTIMDLIQFQLNDPHSHLIMITKTELSSDMAFARIFYRVLGEGNEEDRKLARKCLTRARGHIEGKVNKRFRVRKAIKIGFSFDNSYEKQLKFENIMEEINEDLKIRDAKENKEIEDASSEEP